MWISKEIYSLSLYIVKVAAKHAWRVVYGEAGNVQAARKSAEHGLEILEPSAALRCMSRA